MRTHPNRYRSRVKTTALLGRFGRAEPFEHGGGFYPGSVLLALAAVLLTPDHAVAQQELSKLLPSDGEAYDSFGHDVSVRDGLAVIGASRADVMRDSGIAYVFDAKTGQELRQLVPADPEMYDFFGERVSFNGERAVIGSHRDDDQGADSGSAYVFDVATGQQLFKLLPSDGAAEDQFGFSVACDGNLAIVGAWKDDDHGTNCGAAYVFDISSGQQLLKLVPGVGAYDVFGYAVAIDGQRALVSATGQDPPGPANGAAYVFDLNTGLEICKLVSIDGHSWDGFGRNVALQGARAVVGANEDDDHGSNSGAVYVFDAVTGQQLFKLHAPESLVDNGFGRDVAISGSYLAIGAPGDTDHGFSAGAAHVFDLATGRSIFKVTASDGEAYESFGSHVSIGGDRLVVGVPTDKDNGPWSGSAYVYGIDEPGTGFCFGDPGSGTPCPCSNDNDGSVTGSGCDNGVHASGARLRAFGVASVSADTLVLTATRLEPFNTGLYFQAENDLSPGLAFGDGLRCVGGDVVRVEVRTADAQGTSSTTVEISTAAGNVSPGDTKRYQCWYRTTAFPPCGFGVNDFNLTNGYEVLWLP